VDARPPRSRRHDRGRTYAIGKLRLGSAGVHARVLLSALTLLAGVLVSSRPAAAEPVELQLVLAIDASGSVDAREFDLQLGSIASAFRDPAVVRAIEAARGGIAVTLMQWSDPGHQMVAVPWMLVGDADTAAQFAARVLAAGRLIHGETAIAPALLFAQGLIEESALAARRRAVDVSGDGATNWGVDPDAARDRLVADGITINGLAIINEQPELERYYRDHVIGGPAAFVITAADYEDYARAIRLKLLREIEGAPVGFKSPPLEGP
jgi:hypothetical protein